MTARTWILSAALVALSPLAARALDAPHTNAFSNFDCDNCHTLHVTVGASGDPDYTSGCLSCHNSLSTGGFGQWLSSDQAALGQSGSHHSWSGHASNPRAGARTPAGGATQKQLVDGRLQCTVCHDPHQAAPQNAPDRQHTSIPVGTAVPESGGDSGGTATMTLVTSGASAKAYRLQIATVNGTGGTFVISHDFGLATPSWFNWVGGAWQAGTAAGPGKPYTNDTAVTLDDAAVSVTFTAGAAVGNYWDFWIAYPFLRGSMVGDALCTGCHVERNMTSARVRGADGNYRPNGVRKFSHPVGEALNSNGRNTDRTLATMLDATGVAQATGDANPSNDLRMPGGVVRCTSCHGVHGADSNSLSVDPQ